MRAKVHMAGHPAHPMLVVFPLGLWAFSFCGDIFYLTGWGDVWRVISAYVMAGGIIGALAAAVPGLIDFAYISAPRIRKIAFYHMVLNVSAVLLYTINFLIRYRNDFEMAGLPFVLSTVSVIAIMVAGWLGGEMVYRYKIGVDD